MHNQKNLKSERLRWNHRSVSSCTGIMGTFHADTQGFLFHGNPLLPHPSHFTFCFASAIWMLPASFRILPLNPSLLLLQVLLLMLFLHCSALTFNPETCVTVSFTFSNLNMTKKDREVQIRPLCLCDYPLFQLHLCFVNVCQLKNLAPI